MGLDMYLTGKRYLWGFADSPDQDLIQQIQPLFPEVKGRRITEVSCEMMYWRKANQIHRWFVDNVQEGKDECQETFVSTDQLGELLNLCRAVLAGKGKPNAEANAEAWLPTGAGFFFGSTAYDEYYYSDLEKTVEGLEELLADESVTKHWEFYYRSSW